VSFHSFPFGTKSSHSNPAGSVAAEIDFEGKHLGKFNGNPALGNKFLMRGAFIFDLNKSDKIIGIRSYYDSRLMNRQLEIMKI
jgi:predicted ester cyclase